MMPEQRIGGRGQRTGRRSPRARPQAMVGERRQHRPPEDVAGDEKAQMLGDVDPLARQRGVVEKRQMPDPQGADPQQPGHRRPARARSTPPARAPQQAPRRRGGRPSSSSGGTTSIRSRCCDHVGAEEIIVPEASSGPRQGEEQHQHRRARTSGAGTASGGRTSAGTGQQQAGAAGEHGRMPVPGRVRAAASSQDTPIGRRR